MNLLSLKAHILIGAILWTIGLLAITGVLLHVVMFGHSSVHEPTHSSAQSAFRWAFIRHGPITGVIGAFSMLLGFLEIRRGMSPMNELRHRLAAVHKGIDARVGGRYPSEVQPLVDDLNALLEEREQRVARAVAKAGDLAHGLKTPLAILVQDARQVRSTGHEELAVEIDQQIDRMRRQIDYHLAHARSAASSASLVACAPIAGSAQEIIETLLRLHVERGLRIEIDAPSSHVFRGQREDLDEMLGNLLDNACKWARTQVRLTSSKEGSQIVIAVDDDGTGIDASMREAVMRRGVALDERAQSSGLGLAIVRDMAELYGGSISLEESPMGGLRATLNLPAHDVS